MPSIKKNGYVIARSQSRSEYFTSSAAYDRPEWVALNEATVYSTPELAQQAVKKLWVAGSFASKVKPLTELIDMEIDTSRVDAANGGSGLPDEEAANDMIAARQGEEPVDGDMEGMCPECDCDPCECDDAALADGQPTDHIPTDDVEGGEMSLDALPGEEGLPPEDELRLPGAEHEEDSVLGQHLKAAAGMEGEETARLHPEELRMLGKKRMDMKEAEVKLPKRPGNDPVKSDNDLTVPNLPKDRVAKEIDLEDPTNKADKPDTDLCNATAHEHDEKVKVPAEIISQLKAVVADFKKAAEDNNMRDDTKGSFAMTAMNAMQQLVDDLELGTVAGIKQAQVHMTSYMNPLTSHIPADVTNFIARGGRKVTLKDLFDVKWDKMRGVE